MDMTRRTSRAVITLLLSFRSKNLFNLASINQQAFSLADKKKFIIPSSCRILSIRNISNPMYFYRVHNDEIEHDLDPTNESGYQRIFKEERYLNKLWANGREV